MIVLVLPDLSVEDLLLKRARDGDQEAVMQIYERYFTPLYQFIRLRTDDAQLAEDIASDVFVIFVRSLRGNSAPRHSLRGWLFRVARNELTRQWGRKQRMPTATLDEWVPAPAEETDPELTFIRALNVERARQAMHMLVPEQQEVLVLRFGQNLSLEETADVMDKSVSAVKSLQFRAVNTLRQILGEWRGEGQDG